MMRLYKMIDKIRLKFNLKQEDTGLLAEDPEPEQAPERTDRKNFLQKNLLPLLIVVLTVILAVCCIIKSVVSDPQTIPNAQTYDSCATIAAVGDISLSATQLRSFRTDSGQYDFGDCFTRVEQTISCADFALGNLEGVYGSDDSKTDSDVFPGAFLDALADCGFDYLQTANSQSIKSGIASIEQTISALESRNILAGGTFRTTEERRQCNGIQVVEINGIRFGIMAFTKGLNNMHLPEGSEYSVNLLYTDYDSGYSIINEDAIMSCINSAKAENVDFIIAMVHWGSENDTQISESQSEITDLLINNGVDVIIGSHSHIVGQIEHRYVAQADGSWKDAYIAYSLGDFFTSSEQKKSQYGCILNLRFEKDSESGFAAITEINYTPTYCTSPSKSLGTDSYQVLDSLDAIHLLDQQYYDSITEALSEKLESSIDALVDQTLTDYCIKKDYH